jgi:hypothetical protein
MARKGARTTQELPPPLPPETRTVGQVVAEALNLYRRRFWASLALGPAAAGTAVGLKVVPGWWDLAFVPVAALAMTAAYVWAVLIATDGRVERRALLVAVASGVVVFIPGLFLFGFFVLPAVAWLALFGLAVPAALIERGGFRDSLRRGLELGRADYVHAVGSLATLVIVTFLTATVMFFLLRGGSQIALAAAAFVSLLVISPILFLGAALLYFDQAARVPTRRSDADLHHALEPDRPGRADAEGQP